MSKKYFNKFTVTKDMLLPGVFFALLVRWCVAAYPYSGYKNPPMFGDYEAQRHWQEITVHTPVTKWYHNTTQNDLYYWGLDYPPLTAYHSYLMGLVADWLDPESVRLFASRGYEKESHKTFMRWTVFLSDVYFYMTAVLCLCIDIERVRNKKEDKNIFKRTDIATVLFLLYPGIILIDHGHFQYNCVSLGLFLWSTLFIIAIENDILASFFFVFALNYKQMELYHALPFFFYLLRKCYIHELPPKWRVKTFVHQLNKLIITVGSCFIIIWYPFSGSITDLMQVIHRLFPIQRGVFEDKVSNVWCMINVVVKLKSSFTNEEMAKMCLSMTAAMALPSCLDLFFRINRKKFVLSLINVSLAFFLFSFQVHEKTILLVAIPVALYLTEDPFPSFWFLLVSNFSMFPLLLKDGLLIPFIVTNIIYILAFSIVLKMRNPGANLFAIFSADCVYKIVQPYSKKNPMFLRLMSISFILSFVGMCLLVCATVLLKPPVKYPDLFQLVISVFSCIHFIFFFVYFNYKQFNMSPIDLEINKKVKTR